MGGTLMGRPTTMRRVFECIKNKEIMENDILKEDILNHIFSTIDKVEVSYLKHPGASLGALFKKY